MWFWGGASSALPPKDLTDVSTQDFYSADRLLNLLDSLPSLDSIDERNRDTTIETLRQVAEVLVWGEQHNRGYFDIFCEQNVLSYFVGLAEQQTVPSAVKVQLLQSLSIIVQSINKETAVYYMFSNNYINSLLSTRFDFDDEEVVSWYVSFIKSLSLLVNPATIKLFLNERAKHFPIYSESVKFFLAKDSMDPGLRAFVAERPIFFSHVACYLRELLDDQCSRLATNRGPSLDRSTEDGALEVEEMLFYVQDIFSLGAEEFSNLLAERLLVHCYLPLIGMLRSHDDGENEGKKWSLDEAGTGASETPDEGVEFSGSSDEPSRIGSPVHTTDDDSSVQSDKRLEQGWMWGWTTPENLKDTRNLSGSPDHSGAKGQNSSPRRTVDISKSWRARAAEAVSRRLGETMLQGKVDSMPAMTDGSSKATPSQAVGEESHLLNLSGSNANHNLVQRLILFFLIQTFNCIQSEKLLRPLVACLLIRWVPKPLYVLLMAKAPPTSEAYNNLRNPTQCAGHIDCFLPTQEQSISDDAKGERSKVEVQGEDTNLFTSSSQATSEASSPATRDSGVELSTLSLEDRLKLLKSSMHALDELDRTEGLSNKEALCRQNEDRQHCGVSHVAESVNTAKDECPSRWCPNPIQQHLLTLLDGCEFAKKQCDVCFLVLGILLQSITRSPCTTAGILMHASMIPRMGANELSRTQKSRTRLNSEPEPSAPDLLLKENDNKHQNQPLDEEKSLHWGIERTDIGKMSWHFTAQMLDAIHAHLANPLLRPITLRVVLSVLTTLITEHILKVQNVEYKTRCLEMLVDRALKLRHAAAVATKLCLSALSDGHTIDVFWDEWEVHRVGFLTDSFFSRDFRILMSPQGSQAGTNTFPPYLLVAMTDQEIERRSIQVFLVLRRLHRDLSTILNSIRTRPDDADAVACEASSILYGMSSEPNPFESEDNGDQVLQVDDSKMLTPMSTSSQFSH
ncbi:hypothetical protein, conserved [Eimeria tenella]|uniref:FPL domain-containing protein n=1 Tax=Eimeria tenella TaxID=5802 RepID=U6KPJ7_EIMTE|nr:hypothetical protein, conserved [Eimeria tenella]CDJ37338.1 hypothetical protein, conserved [Eimeria tenella]|eukprot:XP_013228176.1 hypothetical protein, conserved [Eimeria tenella]